MLDHMVRCYTNLVETDVWETYRIGGAELAEGAQAGRLHGKNHHISS